MADIETIAAISTAPGSGGVAIIRLSGSVAIRIVESIFKGRRPLSEVESHKIYCGKIIDPNQKDKSTERAAPAFLDEVLVAVYKAPNSYTKEDVVEINCHGGNFLTHRLLELVLKNGARLARKGEFTERAFLNGRLDLSQAEAVADIINAKTEASLSSATLQLEGALSNRVKQIRKELVAICSLIELELDFAEEDVEFAERGQLRKQLSKTIREVEEFLTTYNRGRILREGVKVVIIGRPNVGKSSLLNALLKKERAIVSEIAGTTRDTLEEQIDIKGVFFRLVDTAGVHETSDKIEKIGVEKTYDEIKEAQIALFVFDGSEEFHKKDETLIDLVLPLLEKNDECKVVAVINKSDLNRKVDIKKIRKKLGKINIVELSAKEQSGFEYFEKVLLKEAFDQKGPNESDGFISNIRQKNALEMALECLKKALVSTNQKLSGEFIVLDMREAMNHLGEIIGEVTSEDILDNIFSQFCIGK